MKTQYELLVSLKTGEGFDFIGQFELGDDRDLAFALFGRLHQVPLSEGPALHLDLVETLNDVPVRVKTIGCNLEQLGLNCRLVTRTLFRLKTLKQAGNN